MRQDLIDAYLQACEIELQTFKPGNVSVYSEGHDMTVEQFRLSAQVSVGPLTESRYSLGEKVYYAVKATREAVACNTNLGIILLCAPLLQAVSNCGPQLALRQAVADVLANTTVADANWVFRAIALASPGGLGKSGEQDVAGPATVTLAEVMALAAEKDKIAFQYANAFKDLFDFTVLEYNRAFVLSGERGWAALTVFTEYLARYPDSHIERKYGKQYSEWIAAEMRSLSEHMKTAHGFDRIESRLYGLDQAFKSKNINPGTSADITVATVLVVLLEQAIRSNQANSL